MAYVLNFLQIFLPLEEKKYSFITLHFNYFEIRARLRIKFFKDMLRLYVRHMKKSKIWINPKTLWSLGFFFVFFFSPLLARSGLSCRDHDGETKGGKQKQREGRNETLMAGWSGGQPRDTRSAPHVCSRKTAGTTAKRTNYKRKREGFDFTSQRLSRTNGFPRPPILCTCGTAAVWKVSPTATSYRREGFTWTFASYDTYRVVVFDKSLNVVLSHRMRNTFYYSLHRRNPTKFSGEAPARGRIFWTPRRWLRALAVPSPFEGHSNSDRKTQGGTMEIETHRAVSRTALYLGHMHALSGGRNDSLSASGEMCFWHSAAVPFCAVNSNEEGKDTCVDSR